MKGLLFLLLFMPLILKAQSKPDTTIYSVVDQLTEYPGGDMKMLKDMSAQVRIPSNTTESAADLSRIVVTVIVEKDGRVSRGKTTRGSITLGEKMIKVLSGAVWQPGIVNGKPVRTAHPVSMTINFSSE
jgi:protein TonB